MLRAKYRWMLTGTPVTNTLYVTLPLHPNCRSCPLTCAVRTQGGYLWVDAIWRIQTLEWCVFDFFWAVIGVLVNGRMGIDWNDFNEYIVSPFAISIADHTLTKEGYFVQAKMQHEDAPLAGLRAQEVLKPILLRRTKGSTLVRLSLSQVIQVFADLDTMCCMQEGEPILKLPPKKIDLVMLEFTAEERDVYDSFEKRTRIRINRFIRARTLLKK